MSLEQVLGRQSRPEVRIVVADQGQDGLPKLIRGTGGYWAGRVFRDNRPSAPCRATATQTPNAVKHDIFTLEKPDIYTLSLHDALSAPVKNVLYFSQIEMSCLDVQRD